MSRGLDGCDEIIIINARRDEGRGQAKNMAASSKPNSNVDHSPFKKIELVLTATYPALLLAKYQADLLND